MTNKEFLIEVQKSCHLEMQQCLMLEGSLQKMLAKAAVDQLPVILSGLGVFTSHKHPEYIQEDAQTGAMTLYPPRISYRMQTDEVEGAVSGVKLLSDYAGVNEDEASVFIEALVLVINAQLQKGEEVEVHGIGTFKNVLTHHSDLQHVAFSPCDSMKQQVNAPFECFEPMVISEGIVKEEVPIEVSIVAEIQNSEPEIINPVPEEDPMPEEEPLAVAESEPVAVPDPKPELPTPDKGKVIIGDEKKSENKLIYTSVSIIMVACAMLVWLMFGYGVDNLGNEVKESVRAFEDDPEMAVVIGQEPANIEAETEPVIEPPLTDTVVVEETKSAPEPVKPIEVKKPEAEKKPVEIQQPEKKLVVAAPQDFHRMIGADGKPVTVKLQAGERLTLIALNHFGDKSFWPYIFDVNADKLKAPNLVQAGMILYLPDPAFYGIDAKDEASLRKAKNRAAQLLK